MIKINNKKGVSEMVGYVLLIVIAISLSIIVYIWIQKYIPKQAGECEDGVSLSVEDYCMYKNLAGIPIMVQVSVKNRGLFNVDGFFIRESNDTGKAIYPMNNNETAGVGRVYLPGFRPNQYYCGSFNDTEKYNTITNIEIEPFKIKGKDVILCDKSIVNIKVGDYECVKSLCEGGASDGSPPEIDNIIEDGSALYPVTVGAYGYSCAWGPSGTYFKESSSTTISVGESSCSRRGYIEFDVSRITNTNIASVSLQLNIYELTTNWFPNGCSIYSMENKPSTSTAEVIKADAESGNLYSGNNLFCATTGPKIINLGSLAVTDLKNQLSSGWFAVGITTNDAGESQVSAEESSNPPKLIITYTTPTP